MSFQSCADSQISSAHLSLSCRIFCAMERTFLDLMILNDLDNVDSRNMHK